MLPRFFIERPIFAWVVAIVIMLAGVVSIRLLPIAQYPDVAPPQVEISATYPGADAQTLENSVTQVLEQQLSGIDHLLYFTSSSSNSGQATITATFSQGADADTAQVQVQNKVQQAMSRLPEVVQQQGVRVEKSQTDFLLVVSISDTSNRMTVADLGDYLVTNLQDPISRVEGVGGVQVFGSQYAMRLWLDPHKLNSFGLTPDDVRAAVLAQNTQVSAGELGGLPSVAGQQLNATVTAQSRLQTPEQFRNIILKTGADGAFVRLGDVARVELGNESYAIQSKLNGHPATGMAVQLAPGGNALDTAEAVKARVTELAASLPPGVEVNYPRDSTGFIRISVEEVVKTLVEAIILVVIVMFIFLQNWRATLIPTLTVPVVLLGTFGVLYAFGYSINTLTLFGMVLAIGLLVDDTIVVVENVERVMSEEGLDPKQATIKSMGEISGALVGIALVLSAVFVPMAFFGGSTGVIYRQFSITIVSSMVLSVIVALTLTPALCATMLKPTHKGAAQNRFFGWFNTAFHRSQRRYDRSVTGLLRRPIRVFVALGAVVIVLGVLFIRLPTGFLPEEDRGEMMVAFQLPTGATDARTAVVAQKMTEYFRTAEKDNVRLAFSITGFSFAGSGQNAGLAFVLLKPWDERKGAENTAQAIAQRATGALSQQLRDVQVFALIPPSIQGLGQTGGFEMQLLDRSGVGRDALAAAQGQLLQSAGGDNRLAMVRPNILPDTPQLQVNVDPAAAAALGLSQREVNSTLSAAWGGSYINDFVDRGRVKRVYMQGDAEYRSAPEDLQTWFVRGSNGQMAPFSAFTDVSWKVGPQTLQRFNGVPSTPIQGQAAPGGSSGAAMTAMEELVAKLPKGVDLAWTGLSYQEKQASGRAGLLYAVSVLVVFLCLAALYESWSVPLAVMLVIPLGVVGAVLGATLRGLANDVYFQVALLTTIGLSAKNAILIVEFAEAAVREGKSLAEAAIEGARLRLRPILMTSLAFIVGVLPLAISTGPGAASRNAIGVSVIGGMITATVLAIFMVPVFYVGVRGLAGRIGRRGPVAPAQTQEA
jgi:multidrug efflux pump